MLPGVTKPEPDTQAELNYLRKLNLALLTLLFAALPSTRSLGAAAG